MRAFLSSLILACALGLSAFFFAFWHTSTQSQHSLNNKNNTLPLDMHLIVLFWLLYNHSASSSTKSQASTSLATIRDLWKNVPIILTSPVWTNDSHHTSAPYINQHSYLHLFFNSYSTCPGMRSLCDSPYPSLFRGYVIDMLSVGTWAEAHNYVNHKQLSWNMRHFSRFSPSFFVFSQFKDSITF